MIATYKSLTHCEPSTLNIKTNSYSESLTQLYLNCDKEASHVCMKTHNFYNKI